MNLPTEFLERMKLMLGDEYEKFIECYDEPALRGIRLNTLKCDIETLKKSIPFDIAPSPFSQLSYYVKADDKFGDLPAHHAGMFYSQEPSASSAVTVLNPQKGDKVLDLCAAPGGKSTQIAAMLMGEGLLWSNEIVKERANILLSNIERMGVKNAVVSTCHPQKLCSELQGYFDKVLVDAPCSGEGMFRRDEIAVKEWSIAHVKACAVRQLSILNSAAVAVKQGGVLVYSTCTFSKEENEEVVELFLKENQDFKLDKTYVNFGRAAYDDSSLRIFPTDRGEGHFVSKLTRVSDNLCKLVSGNSQKKNDMEKMAEELYNKLFKAKLESQIISASNKLYIIPNDMPHVVMAGIIRVGVELGEIRGNRIEPSHSLFMSEQAKNCNNIIDFAPEDLSLHKFLSGEEIDVDTKGYTAVAVNGVITGFGKASNGRLKNKYPKGLRLRR